MTAQRRFFISLVMGAIVAGLLTLAFGMPEFILAASPGLVLSMAIAGNVHAFSVGLIFLGNWIFYSLIIMGIVEVAWRLRGWKNR